MDGHQPARRQQHHQGLGPAGSSRHGQSIQSDLTLLLLGLAEYIPPVGDGPYGIFLSPLLLMSLKMHLEGACSTGMVQSVRDLSLVPYQLMPYHG